jgi:hypothetical protein
MDQLTAVLDQLLRFTVQHAPDRIPTGALPVALLLLGVGVALSVVGAKFARFGLTTAFVVLGGLLGNQYAINFEFNRPISVAVGAALIGLIGFQTFRLWVGVAVAGLLSAIVLGGFSVRGMLPHLTEYVDTSAPIFSQPVASGEPEFMIPSPELQAAYTNRDPGVWFSDFWKFLTEHDPKIARNTQALAILTALGGLCLGLIAVRPSLIAATSLAGTGMVVAGIGTLMASSVPSAYASVQSNPRIIGLAILAFLAASLVLQTLLMRKSTVGGPKPAKT